MFSSTQRSSRRVSLRALVLALIALSGIAGKAYSQCSSPANQIVAENCLPGSPASEWDVGENSSGDPTIQGFATDISVNQGGTVYFKINTPASAYTINIYRMGYYGGMGARHIAQVAPSVSLPQAQPNCITDATVGLADCGNWAISASWQVPANAVSGIYFAHLVRSDTGGDSQIVFVVRNDSSTSPIMFQTADETWQAYNYYGAGSVYGQNTPVFNLNNRSYKVSYNRPFLTRGFQEESDTYLFGAEFAMVQWLESNGYDVTYFTSVDAARNGALIKNHRVFMDAGHDEYWSGPRRANVQAARDAGVNLAFFSGNEMFWKTRWENSIDGTNTPYRTLVCYKETLAFAQIDPDDPPTWTGTWRDPSFSPPSDGGKPENALTGTIFMVNGTGPDNAGDQRITIPAADGKMRFWRNTAVASLTPTASYTLPVATLGYEWDVDADNGFRPAGAFHLSTSTYTLTADYLLDYGATYGAGVATHHLMEYRAPSGALVFGAGTINWSWGLNSNHDNPFSFNTPNPDVNMQQATVNLLADMGVQPGSLQSGLATASASSDTTPPISVITSPAGGTPVSTGNTIAVSGTATDSGGGVVAGVEVSTDGGTTWHPATGRGTWSYSWTPTAVGSPTLLSRAVDDSGNLEIPTDATVVSVAPQTCPCSIWNAGRSPNNADSGDSNAVEVGVKFRADANGSVIGVKFYKATTNTGTHVGHIWTDTGTLLGTATFTGESGSGWQQVYFSTPIPVTANTTYVVSYFAPKGHYAADPYYFATSGTDNPPLHALQSGVDGQNGLFFYGASGGFPTSSYLASNYWVDVLFTSSNTYNITGQISGYGGAGASVALTGTETATVVADSSGNYAFDGIVSGNYTVTPANPGVTFTPASQQVAVQQAGATGVNFTAVVTQPQSISGTLTGGAGATVNLGGAASATTTADASGNYSFQGLLSGTYTVTPILTGTLFTPGTQSVTLSGAGASAVNFQGAVCNCISIWPASATPTEVDSNDPTPIEVGVKFTVDVPGFVDGIRFYKAGTNIGTHIGHLWTSTGTLLGTVTFTGESASGWQVVNFASPIQVTPGTTYVASYLAPVGHYSADVNFFATSGVDNPPIHAMVNTSVSPDGVYIYTSTGAFPNNTYSSTNYWVDVLYTPATSYSLSGTITGGAGATVTLAGSNHAPVTADSFGNYTFSQVYSGTYSVIPSSPGLVFSPGNQNVTVASAPLTGVNFTVPQLCPCDTVWTPATLPAVIDSNDPLSYELGMKFEANADGYVLGIRFYKAQTNTGLHIGNLWSTSSLGSPLASAPFAGESASGWQQVLFNNPIPVSGNTAYIGSYFTPTGHYSVNTGFFATAVDSPPLTALASGADGPNGVYTQSSMSAFPNTSYENDNYWVDVIYSTASSYSIGGTVSGIGYAGVNMALSGPTNAVTTTDAYGNYYFNNLANGTYTVTPSEPGFVITPASQTIVVSGGHQLTNNFTSALPTYAVSGAVTGGPGIQLTLAGTVTTTSSPLSVTVTADGSGNYTFPAVPNGSYTITPTTVGFVATPGSQSIIVNGAGVSGINFSAIILYYTVSGTISGGAGATVTLAGPVTSTATADGSGNFTFSGVTVGSYSVTPTLTGVAFNPGNITIAVTTGNITGVNFTALNNCPCDTIWQPTAVPALIDSNDVHAVEVGVKFRVDADGYIAGLRYYKASTNIGTHIGNVWTSTGTLLGTATFVNEGSSGWQQVLFATPIPVAANTTYIASYFSPIGHYSADVNYFLNTGVDSPPVHALQNGIDGPNGVYLYSTTSGFPTATSSAANYWVDVIYTPAATYSITGTLSGSGGPGATVTLGGAATATTTAGQTGNFIFNGLSNGSYVVTPAASGYTFTPTTLNATINNAHALGLSFTSGTTYTIGGTITGPGGSGATVSLSGASTATVIADSSGNWSFPGLANGNYTVSVVNAGYSFTPASQPVTVNSANTTAAFSSVALTYTLSGTISGAGGAGATVSLSGVSTATTNADPSGNWSFANLVNGVYTVAVTNAGFVFTPASQSITITGANATTSFSSAAQTYSLTGTISGAGGPGATVALSGPAAATTVANASGIYSFTGLASGAYTVSVTNAGYVFTPATQAVTLSGANATANFNSAVATYTLSGTITGTGISGATVTLTGAATATTVTNAAGAFSFAGLLNGAYVVAAASPGYVVTPPSQAVTISGANAVVTFASVPTTYTISGTISGPGGAGATVTLTGATNATATASSTGVYTFTGVPAGLYTITPTNGIYAFTPASRNVTLTTVNLIENFATVTYTISGTVNPGATVKLTGTSTGTTTADASGNYSFTGRNNGSYTVTPSQLGYVFTPASQPVIVAGANSTVGGFTPSTATFTISGTISGPGGPGATVNLAGPTNGVATATSSGTYSFTGLTIGTYTITPSNGIYAFTPASKSVTVTTANVTGNFATVSYTISGTANPGATVRLTGTSTGTTTADASGNYSFTARNNGTYTVTPSQVGYIFSPASQPVIVAGANVTVGSFSTSIATFTISGTITGAGGPGATVVLAGPTNATTVAGSTGAYSFSGVTVGSYTITPSNGLYQFSPANRAVTLSTANLTENFSTVTYTISGALSGPGAAGATVRLAGTSTGSTTSDAAGNYSFTGRNNGSYIVTPTQNGYAYSPASQVVTVAGANATVGSINSSVVTYTISGTIGGAGGPGATVSLAGPTNASTVANASGFYSFGGVTVGAYTITPSNGIYAFNPVNRAVALTTANLTENFSTVTYTISGTVTGPGASGATVKLAGTSTGSTTADASGNYAFTARNNGSYTVSASKTGFVFTPASQPVTISGANATVAPITSTAATYTLSGTISGAGGPGALVTLAGAANATTTANSSGAFSFSGLLAGSYTVTPTNSGHTFTPASKTSTITTANVTDTFTSK